MLDLYHQQHCGSASCHLLFATAMLLMVQIKQYFLGIMVQVGLNGDRLSCTTGVGIVAQWFLKHSSFWYKLVQLYCPKV
eukprot:2910523-Rhodomonas_salina.1